MSAVSAFGTPGRSSPLSRANRSRRCAPGEWPGPLLAFLWSALVTVRLPLVSTGKAGMADHVVRHHIEDVAQTVVDVQGTGLHSGGLIAVMDGHTDGQML